MKILTYSILGLLMFSSCKDTLVCRETESSYTRDLVNSARNEKANYTYEIGQSAMNPDGSFITYTKEYINQQKAELEASGRFYCEWE